MADEDWRVEVELDDEEQGYSVAERLHAGDLDDQARERLEGQVGVSRDGSHLFLYAADETQAREAERVVRELVDRDGLSAEITLRRWHPVQQEWEDPSVPLPTTPEAVEEELDQREAADEQEAEETHSWNWHVRAELRHRGDAVEVEKSLQGEGFHVHRRWRYVTVDVATEEAARELADRLAAELPDGAELVVETKPPDPIFVFLGSRGV